MNNALKQMLDKYDVGLFEFLKDIGMVKSYTKYSKLYKLKDITLTDLDLEFLLAFCNKFNVNIQDLLEEFDKNAINSKINVIRYHIDMIEKRINKMCKGTIKPNEKIRCVFEKDKSGKEKCYLTFLLEKLDTANRLRLVENNAQLNDLRNIPVCAHMTCDDAAPASPGDGYAKDTSASRNIAARAGEVPATNDVSVSCDLSKNSVVRVFDTDDSHEPENIAARESADNVDNIDGVDSIDDIDELDNDIENSDLLDDLSKNSVLYHNIDEANRIFKRSRKIRKIYEESPEVLNVNRTALAKYNLLAIPERYLPYCSYILEGNRDEDDGVETGTLTAYYSVFNRRKEFLFSEVYSARYVIQDDSKDVKYYRRTFYDLVKKGMEFDFDEDEEISEADFYHGIYRVYRPFNFQR